MKNKIVTVGIIIATLILAGVAIFTAIRLYQLRQEAVAPTAPTSKPKAQEVPIACQSLAFTLQQPGLNCTSKRAWKDDSRNASPIYYLENEIGPNSNLTNNQIFLYSISYKNTGTATANAASITDILPSQVNFIDADTGCAYTSATRTVVCNLGDITPTGNSQKIIRVKVSISATSGPFINSAVVSSGASTSNCEIALNIQAGSPTPTPTPTTTPTATPTNPPGEPNSCNGTCGSNYNCQSGLFCYQGFCRNTSCPSDTDCTCPGTSTPTSTPTATLIAGATPTGEPALPSAGVSLPTIFGIGLGTLLLIGAILLAL